MVRLVSGKEGFARYNTKLKDGQNMTTDTVIMGIRQDRCPRFHIAVMSQISPRFVCGK